MTSTATLMRTASVPVQAHLAQHDHAAVVSRFGHRRGSDPIPSPQSLRLFGRDRRRAAAANIRRVGSEPDPAGSHGQVGSRSRPARTINTAVEDQDGPIVLETESVALGPQPAGVYCPEFLEEAGGGGRGREKDVKEGTGPRGGEGEGEGDMGAYYREILEADPGNPLLLRNYGKYLHELKRSSTVHVGDDQVEGDVEGAEECYGRAILGSSGDGELLSLYGKLIWEAHRDEGRAEAYFELAVEASPDDCYVLGSYAYFLWDAEEEEEEEERPSSSSAATSSSSSRREHLLEVH